MSNFVVEHYRPSWNGETLRTVADRLAAGVRHVSGEGTPVRYVDTIFLPGDETCLHVFEADSEEDVRAVARRAGIDVDRVAPAEQIEPRDESVRLQGPERRPRDDKPARADTRVRRVGRKGGFS